MTTEPKPDQSTSAGLIARARMASLEPYTDAPRTTQEWLRALELGADAAVCVVLEHLAERVREVWVDDVHPEGRSDLDQMWNNALLIPRREIEALLKEVTDG